MGATSLLEVGRTGRAHGVRGDLYVDLITDRVERLAPGARLEIAGRWRTITASRPAGRRWLVHFEGVDDRTAAEALAGQALLAEPIADRGDGIYVDQLIGAEVLLVDGTRVGSCVAVVDNPAHDLLELDTGALVPMVFVVTVAEARVVIDPPQGLFDLP